MALRDVTVRYTLNEMVDDENAELWLKRGADPWELYDTVAVDDSPATTQDFDLLGLEEGVVHQLQARAIREGRYRAGYLSSNPDNWPGQSLISFEPGTAQAGAPTLNSATWARTAADAQAITVNATPSDLALTIQLLRNGSVVDEIAGPHAGAVNLVDQDPPIAEEHSYRVRHVAAGPVYGELSAAELQWAGPDATPTSLAEGTTGFYSYEVTFDAPPSGYTTRVQDDYLCSGNFVNRGVTAPDATSFETFALEKESGMASNGNVPANFQARARHEVTTFGVADGSPWSSPVAIEAEMASDETAFDSCP